MITEVEGITLMVPAAYDVVWSLVVLALIGLTAVALVVWSRARVTRGGGGLDLALILLVPVVGPAAYLTGQALARRAPRARTDGPHA